MWPRDRHDDELSERQLRELDALDLVLAAGPAAAGLDPEHAPLVGLVAAVRDDRPPLRPAFADELGRRVSGGFARRERQRRRQPRGQPGRWGAVRKQDGLATQPLPSEPRPTRTLRPPARPGRLLGLGGAGAAAVVVALVVAGGLGSGAPSPVVSGSPTSGPADSIHAESAPRVGAAVPGSPAPGVGAAGQSSAQSPASAGSSAPSIALPAPAPSSLPGPGGKRSVESQASISLLAPAGQVQKVADAAIAAADRLGGIVASSNVTLGDQGGSQATIDLTVPSAAVGRTLAALSSLAHVTARSQDTLDITDTTRAAGQRLAESRAERVALLRQLGRAATPGQVASIHAQLGLVGGRITSDEASVRTLVHSANTASVSVTITESGRAAVVGGSSTLTPGGALDAALKVLEAAFAVLVIALAVLLPAGAVGGLAWYWVRAVRRRRRQGALAA